jgi:hypothetical protein
LFFVLLLYDCKEASKIDWKVDEDEDEEAMKETGMMSRMMSGHEVLSPVRDRTTSHLAPTTTTNLPQCIHSSPDAALLALHQHDMDQTKHVESSGVIIPNMRVPMPTSIY